MEEKLHHVEADFTSNEVSLLESMLATQRGDMMIGTLWLSGSEPSGTVADSILEKLKIQTYQQRHYGNIKVTDYGSSLEDKVKTLAELAMGGFHLRFDAKSIMQDVEQRERITAYREKSRVLKIAKELVEELALPRKYEDKVLECLDEYTIDPSDD